uniref:Ubiquitin-like domain-containing protein n=1 Tax=Romanomermis culicivorax TaxID=13658 RepID=A0A915L9X7_ROMCU
MNIEREICANGKNAEKQNDCCPNDVDNLMKSSEIDEKVILSNNDTAYCESTCMCTWDEKVPDETADSVSVTVVFGAEKYDMKVHLNETVLKFRSRVESLTGVPSNMQKLICKGLKLVEDGTLQSCKITDGSKIMLIGTRLKDIINTSDLPAVSDLKEEAVEVSSKEPLCRQKIHVKILEKGIPEDAMPGIKGELDPLPECPISGMLNKRGGKVRLTFKLEADQVWIGTKERTDKIPMNQIKNVISEPIEFHEEYHIMALQLGPTEQSRYFLYWVPAQYVSAIKNAIMGP